jgi:hypothetical protein
MGRFDTSFVHTSKRGNTLPDRISTGPPAAEEWQFTGAHNATGTVPAFLLPVLTRLSANALYYQVLSADLSTVLDFEVLVEPFAIEALERPITVNLGGPAIHAFASAGGILVGTKHELTARLLSLIDQPELTDSPILRLEVVDFCGADARLRDASIGAYKFLREISKFSADIWRDHTYLSNQARRRLHSALERTGLAIGVCKGLLETVEFTYSKGVARVHLGSDLYSALKAGVASDNLRSFVFDDLRKHISAFGVEPFRFAVEIEGADVSESESLRPVSRRLSQYRNATKLVVPLGRNLLAASRSIASAQARHAVYLDEDISDPLSVERCLKEINGSFEAVEENLPLIVVVDAHDAVLDLLGRLVTGVRSASSIHVAVFYRTRDGEPVFPVSSLTPEIQSKIRGATLIPENDFPLGDAVTKTSRSVVLSSFMSFLDHLYSLGKEEAFQGTTVYGMGWTRGGIGNYAEALGRSIAAAANPILPITLVKNGFGLISSVGAPPGSIGLDVQGQINGALEEQLQSRIEVDVQWHKRRFVPGGSVPTKFEFLGRIDPSRIRAFDGLADAAKTILLLSGFQISVTSENGSVFNAVKDSNSIHFSTERDREVGFPRIWVPLSEQRRMDFLRQTPALGDVLPLLLGELIHLGGSKGPMWAARVMATLAYPPEVIREPLATLIDDALMQEVQLDQTGDFGSRLADGKSVRSLSSRIRKIEKISGKRARLFALVSVRLRDTTKDTQEKSVVITIGPETFSIE